MSLRLVHFTDVHITAPPTVAVWRYAFSKRILGWLNLTIFRRHKDFAEAGAVLRAFVSDVQELGPDHIVCTGDLTGLSLPEEFAEAAEILAPLLNDPRVTGIPGNHDVYVRSAVRQRLYERSFEAWTRTDFSPADFAPESAGSYPFPLVRFLGSDGVLVALNDVKPNALHDSSGRVGALQLAALERVLDDARVRACRARVLACHTSVLRAEGVQDRWHHALRDGNRLLELAARGGVSLLLHGHVHHRFVSGPMDGLPVAIANPGSLTSARGERAYHIYTLENGRITVEARRYNAERGSFEAWNEEPPRRLEVL